MNKPDTEISFEEEKKEDKADLAAYPFDYDPFDILE